MPNFAAKYSSEYLTADRMDSALRALPTVLLELFGECTFTVRYGWAANLHSDLLYVPMRVQTSVLPFFIQESVDQRIIVPGESDLNITSPDKELDLLYCHESDIHVDGDSLDFIQRFVSAKPFSTIRFYSQAQLQLLYPNANTGQPQSPPSADQPSADGPA